MKIIITGALGHIGSQLIREIPLDFPEAEVIMLDNLVTQRYCSLFKLPQNGKYRFIETDILTEILTVFKNATDLDSYFGIFFIFFSFLATAASGAQINSK